MDVQRFETDDDTLIVRQLITVRNDSQPPRTLMNDRPFEIELPSGAKVDSGLVQVGEGQPLKQKPVSGERAGQYFFAFPIRPGDTRFAVVYRLPYNGSALIQPKIRNAGERFVIMVPKSMKLTPQNQETFQNLPDTTPDDVRGTGPVLVGQNVAFQIAGTGKLSEFEPRRRQEAEVAEKTRPGGGLGRPIDAPDPLSNYRWSILAGFGIAMLAGAVFVARRTPPPPAREYQTLSRQLARASHATQPRTRRDRRRKSQVRDQMQISREKTLPGRPAA
jgi:hypothetical protein